MKNFWIHFKTLGKISMPLTLGTLSSVLMVLIDSYFALTISASSYKAVFLTLPIVSLVSDSRIFENRGIRGINYFL